jgi:hypothetical protein
MTPSPLRLLAVTLLAVCLGFLTVLLLPFVFLVWYDAYWRRHEVEAHLSAAMPSPAEAVQCQAGDVEKEEHPFFVQWAQAEAERAQVERAVDTIAHILVEAKMYAYLKELEQKFQESWKDD